MGEANQVQPAQQNMATAVPDHLAGYVQQGVGQIKVDMKELRIPMLKKIDLQGEAYDATKDNFGNIYDNISMEDFGTTINIVVCDYKPEWLKWNKQRKMLGRSNDGVTWQQGEAEYVGKTLLETEGKDVFKCKHYNYYVLLVENGVPRKLPYKMSLSGMSAKAGDKIYQVLAQRGISGGYPMFAFGFKITTTRENGDSGSYAQFHADLLKEFAPKAVVDAAAEFVKTLADPNTKIVEKEDIPAQAPTPAPVNIPPQAQTAAVQADPHW